MHLDNDVQEQLIAIKANLRASAFWLAALRLHGLLGKANFNPNQPRVPRGFREGGRWTREGGPHTPTSRPKLEFDEKGRPKLPATKPGNVKVRNILSKELAKWVARRVPALRMALDIIDGVQWLSEYANEIASYLDPPTQLEELQQAASENPRAPPGYERHHIVEWKAAALAGFPPDLIEAPENLVLIPKYKHHEITGWFMHRTRRFGGLSPREYLSDKTWEERRLIGILALIEAGVLTP